MYAFAMASQAVDPQDRVDVVAVLGRGLVVWAREQEDGFPELAVSPTMATHLAWIPAAEDTMLMLYLFLINGLAGHVQPPYSPGQYIEAAGVLKDQGSWMAELAEINFPLPGADAEPPSGSVGDRVT